MTQQEIRTQLQILNEQQRILREQQDAVLRAIFDLQSLLCAESGATTEEPETPSPEMDELTMLRTLGLSEESRKTLNLELLKNLSFPKNQKVVAIEPQIDLNSKPIIWWTKEDTARYFASPTLAASFGLRSTVGIFDDCDGKTLMTLSRGDCANRCRKAELDFGFWTRIFLHIRLRAFPKTWELGLCVCGNGNTNWHLKSQCHRGNKNCPFYIDEELGEISGCCSSKVSGLVARFEEPVFVSAIGFIGIHSPAFDAMNAQLCGSYSDDGVSWFQYQSLHDKKYKYAEGSEGMNLLEWPANAIPVKARYWKIFSQIGATFHLRYLGFSFLENDTLNNYTKDS